MQRGFCVGTILPSLDTLNSTWAYGVGINSMSDEFQNLPAGIEFVPLTFEQAPNDTWARFAKQSNYSGYWLIGNEPRTANDGYKPIAEIAQIFQAQMITIRSFDPNAKFILTCSTQGQVPYNRHSNANFIGDLWAIFPNRIRKLVTGFHLHIYPRWISDDPAERWDVKWFTRYIRGMCRWMEENAITDKEIWISEFGFEGYFAQDANEYANCARYIKDVLSNKYLNDNVARIAFYVATSRIGSGGSNSYCSLLDAFGQRTLLGDMWTQP